MAKELIRLEKVSMAYDGEEVLKSIDLTINDKEFLTLLGPSGCGKTTTLRIIGGFETPKSGNVYFDGVRINDVPPYKRRVNTVFQRYALFPHLNVAENVAFGLRVAKRPKKEINERVSEMLALVGLRGYEHRDVSQLSGGQQQRVAIARSLASGAKILLADEPTGNLDVENTIRVMEILKSLADEQGYCVIVVTHDSEVAEMADVVYRMKDGVLSRER